MESQVRSEFAYILFYKRKDLDSKQLREVYPIINNTKFRGMPIRTLYGMGFLWDYEKDEGCPYKVKLKNNVSASLK
jgi:hypothetical protein